MILEYILIQNSKLKETISLLCLFEQQNILENASEKWKIYTYTKDKCISPVFLNLKCR